MCILDTINSNTSVSRIFFTGSGDVLSSTIGHDATNIQIAKKGKKFPSRKSAGGGVRIKIRVCLWFIGFRLDRYFQILLDIVTPVMASCEV